MQLIENHKNDFKKNDTNPFLLYVCGVYISYFYFDNFHVWVFYFHGWIYVNANVFCKINYHFTEYIF